MSIITKQIEGFAFQITQELEMINFDLMLVKD